MTSERNAAPTRLVNLDLARVISAIAVIWLHVSAEVVVADPSVRSLSWWIGNTANALSRWSVPVFVMLSGALLIPKARVQSPRTFIAHRVPRLAFLTLAWTVLYGTVAVQTEPLITILKRVAIGAPYYHLWFLYMLVGLYIAAPFIQRLVDALDSANLGLFLTLAFFLSGTSEAFRVFYPAPTLFFTSFLSFIGYFALGDVLASRSAAIAGKAVTGNWLIAAALAFGTAAAVMAGLLLPTLGTRSWAVMYGNQNPLVVLMSISVFVYFLTLPRLSALATFAPLTLGVYLIHPLVLMAVSRLGIDGFLCGPAVGIPLTTLIVAVGSAACVFAIRAIPGVRVLC